MNQLSWRLCLFFLLFLAEEARAGSMTFLGKPLETWRKELDSPTASVRRSAAFALGRMGDDARGTVQDLVRVLRSDKEASVREMAASAIGDIVRSLRGREPTLWNSSGKVLLSSLKNDDNPRVRRGAAYAIGAFGAQATGASDALVKALRDDGASVRQNAAWALGQLGASADGAVDPLCDLLNDRDPLVRRDAAGALGAMGKAGAQAGRPLIQLVKSEPDAVVRRAALDSLSYLAGPEHAAVAEGLEPLLEDKDAEIRFGSAIVLARIGGQRAVRALPVLRTALKEPDTRIQELVTAALSKLGPEAKPALEELAEVLVNEKAPLPVRRNAALAIGHVGEDAKPAIAAVVKAMERDQPPELRRFASEALAQIKYPANKEAIPAILRAIQEDKDAIVREKCVWSLFPVNSAAEFRALGADKVLEKVLNEKGDDAALVRYDAARKLANVLRSEAPTKTIDVLLEMLTNRGLHVYHGTDAKVEGASNEAAAGRAKVEENLGGDARYMAAQALSWMGGKVRKRTDVMDALRKAAKDDDPKLREEAKKALMELSE